MSEGVNLLKEWKIPTEVKVVSAHRTPEFMQEYALKAQDRGLQVILAGAGGAAHLPGMLASLTVRALNKGKETLLTKPILNFENNSEKIRIYGLLQLFLSFNGRTQDKK